VERPEFLIDFAERAIVEEEGFINLGQAFEDGGVGPSRAINRSLLRS
jgi:hypothetical protein